jgi:hypothetical protein
MAMWVRACACEVDVAVSHTSPLCPAVPKSVNSAFGQFVDMKKREYVGEAAYQQATSFARWVKNQARALVDYARFDPVADLFHAK